MKLKISMDQACDLILTKIYMSYTNILNGLPPNYLPILLEGTYGIGKTTVLKNLTTKLEQLTGKSWGFIKWNMSVMSQHQLQGIPKIEDNTFKMVTENSLPTEDNKEGFPEQGILYLDEINHIEDPMKISVLHSLLQENILNGAKIPDSWFIVASGNAQSDGGLYYKLSPGVRDRLIIFDVNNPLSKQLEFFESVGVHPSVIDYIRRYSTGSTDITQTFNPNKEMEDDEGHYIFTTRRSIHDASNSINDWLQLPPQMRNETVLLNLLCGHIGKKEGRKLFDIFKDRYLQQLGKDMTGSLNKSQGTTNNASTANTQGQTDNNSPIPNLSFATGTMDSSHSFITPLTGLNRSGNSGTSSSSNSSPNIISKEDFIDTVNQLEFNEFGIELDCLGTHCKLTASPYDTGTFTYADAVSADSIKLVYYLLLKSSDPEKDKQALDATTINKANEYATSRNFLFKNFPNKGV